VAGGVFDDASGEGAAVLGTDGEVFVAVADDLVGIDHVGEDGIEITAAAADEVWAHLLAAAVELMADHAGGGEDEFAIGEIGLAGEAGLFLLGDERLHVIGGILPGAEDFEGLIADGFVLAGGEGTADGNGEAGGADFAFGDGIEHGLGPGGAGAEGFERGDANVEVFGGGLLNQRRDEVIAAEVCGGADGGDGEGGGGLGSEEWFEAFLHGGGADFAQGLQDGDAFLFGLLGVVQGDDHFLHGGFIAPEDGEGLAVLADVGI
jgi:hypothetical protein